jgi:hypothetical protein
MKPKSIRCGDRRIAWPRQGPHVKEYRISKRLNTLTRRRIAAGLLLGALCILLAAVVHGNFLAIEPAGCILLAGVCALLAAWVTAPAASVRIAGVLGGIIVATSMLLAFFAIASRTRQAGTIELLMAMHVWPMLTSAQWFVLNRCQSVASAPLRIRRATTSEVTIGFFGKLLVAAALVGSYDYPCREHVGWSASDTGVVSPLVAGIAVILGAAASLPYLRLLAALPRGSRGPQVASRRADLAVLGQNLPRGRFWRGLNLFKLVLLGPLLEEVVWRGFFVYRLGNLIGSVAAAIAIGLALCLCVHLYQGAHCIGRHIAFYTIVVTLLYSPLGLTAAVGFHVGCDFWYAMNSGAVVRHYRSYHAALSPKPPSRFSST